MGLTQFNGSSVSFADNAGTTLFSGLGITSFDFQGGDRAEIDVTTSQSASRISRAGFRSPRRISLGVLFEDPTLTELDAEMQACAPGTLAVSASVDCAAASQVFSLNAYLMSYSITAQMDGVWEVSLDFLVDETPAEDGA